MYSSNWNDPPRSPNDRDMPHEYTRTKKTQKYLKESCHHRIKCPVATFLTAFMWRRLLNSAAVATTTHRKSGKMSDGTGTQVRVQMVNKCKIKMVQRVLYNGRDPLWRKDRKNRERENTVAIQIVFVLKYNQFIQVWPPWTESPLI